mmetsp:Transcript_18588/g.28932  ORF Transcript_18588/g.28932 Transcript_18588/m.28932 type:complete len:205 (-) Transcript_18588:7456-8070(-)
MAIINLYTSVIDTGILNVDKLTLLKWGVYFLEIIASSQAFGVLYDKLRFRVGDKTYCWAYGSVSKCNFGVQLSFLGLLASMYTLTMSVFDEFMDLPPIMKFEELDLSAFRLGIWVVTGPTLDDWFVKKFEKKYARGTSHPKDRIQRIKRMDKMIGYDVRKVRMMWRLTIIWIIVGLAIQIVSKIKIWYKSRPDDEGKKRYTEVN